MKTPQGLYRPAESAGRSGLHRQAGRRRSRPARRAPATRDRQPWNAVSQAVDAYRNFYVADRFLEANPGSGRRSMALRMRSFAWRPSAASPTASGSPGYSDSALPLVEKRMLDPRADLSVARRADDGDGRLSKTREYLGADEPQVKAAARQGIAGRAGRKAGRGDEARRCRCSARRTGKGGRRRSRRRPTR